MSDEINPYAASVFPREEYFYRDKDRLLAPKLDRGKKFGTYGMIVIQVNWYYPIIPGELYHPVDNAEEASYWVDFYKNNSIPNKADVKSAYFVPAPDQTQTGTFVAPSDVASSDVVAAPDRWYDYIYDADAYTTFPTVVNTTDQFYT